jgi:hypothetical protein
MPWLLLVASAMAVDEPLAQDAGPQSAPAEEVQDPGSPFEPVPEDLLGLYFNAWPSSYLTDPQRLLPPPDFRERLDFLNYHADDSGMDLYVFVFDGDQVIPEPLRMVGLDGYPEIDVSNSKPAVLLYYHYNAPQRSSLWLPANIEKKMPAGERRLLLESPAIMAGKESDPARQFQSFLVQLSIRLYRLETLLEEQQTETGLQSESSLPQQKDSNKPGPFDFLTPWFDGARPYFPHGLSFVLILLVGICAVWWNRRRASYRFTDFEVEPRLGGSHAAGVGAVISFASTSLPPASQRDAIPDYLRRTR